MMILSCKIFVLFFCIILNKSLVFTLNSESDDEVQDGITDVSNKVKFSPNTNEKPKNRFDSDLQEDLLLNLPTSIPSEKVVYESDIYNVEKYKTYPPSPFSVEEDFSDEKFRTMALGAKQKQNKKVLYTSYQPTFQNSPTSQPSSQPSKKPTSQPSYQPSRKPTQQPSKRPSSQPSSQPSKKPTSQPSQQPSMQPTVQPSYQPFSRPTIQPSRQPSSHPSFQPTSQPTWQPTSFPSMQPSSLPSEQPSSQPSKQPNFRPSSQPSRQPSTQPTKMPSTQPTSQPSVRPSSQPTQQPSSQPSSQPSCQPSSQPTTQPSDQPSSQPSQQPSSQPSTQPSSQPSSQPSIIPSKQPSSQPSIQPSTQPTQQPSTQPTSQPSIQPSSQPTSQPSSQPTSQPSTQPSSQPTTQPSDQPSSQPSQQPSSQPSTQPSDRPSQQPSVQPTTQPSSQPSKQPSTQPTQQPSTQPTSQPSIQPSSQPTQQPSSHPSSQPSTQPSCQPTTQPSKQPLMKPSFQPSSLPTMQPSCQPSKQPSMQPSKQPSSQPSTQPSRQPSKQPSKQPTSQPSKQPTKQPTSQPSKQPTSQPTKQPSKQPTSQPSLQPFFRPSGLPTIQPSTQPSCQPSIQPTTQPSIQPSSQPSTQPSKQPIMRPTMQPSKQPTSQPSLQPYFRPSSQPTKQPIMTPSMQPSNQPLSAPTSYPTLHPVVSTAFDQVSLVINSTLVKTAFSFSITFRAIRAIYSNEYIIVKLPRFTRNLKKNNNTSSDYFSIAMGSILLSPSYYYEAEWVEGTLHNGNETTPYANSLLIIKIKQPEYSIIVHQYVTIEVYQDNGIGAICGHMNSTLYNSTGEGLSYPQKPFQIAASYRNYSYAKFGIDAHNFDNYTGVGNGCTAMKNCNNNGQCNFCNEKCVCFDGYGSSTDIIMSGRDIQPDCSSRICPYGKAIVDIATARTKAHANSECSNMGICNRNTGECKCLKPFTGAACDKLSCPNDCSGHGECLTMEDLSAKWSILNPNQYTYQYGSGTGIAAGTAWDYRTMRGCDCYSSWSVGYQYQQTQLAEYFGPDCSLKRCPSGNDPYTETDETDCLGMNQNAAVSTEKGVHGNLCHIDCSNRGVCDHSTGICKCFEGSWGNNCAQVSNAGGYYLTHNISKNATEYFGN